MDRAWANRCRSRDLEQINTKLRLIVTSDSIYERYNPNVRSGRSRRCHWSARVDDLRAAEKYPWNLIRFAPA
jgi:hypothetical protein